MPGYIYRGTIRDTPEPAPKPRKPKGHLEPCGTRAAFARHKRRGEPIDEACRLHHNECKRIWRAQKRRDKRGNRNEGNQVTITVYTKPNCQPCRATKRWLDNREVEYSTVDVTTSPADLEAIKSLGYEGVPVVIVSNGDAETDLHWHGFHPDNLGKYTTPAAQAA